MNFFFVQDARQKYRYFSSEPLSEIQVEFSRFKKFWETAKNNLLKLLPLKLLKQELAFEQALKLEDNQIRILYSGEMDERKIGSKFYYFLQRQRTKHIILLVGESILLPITGIAALLPGPNMLFYVLALLVLIQWHALRGINRLLKKDHLFIRDLTLKEWEVALKNQKESMFPLLLENIEKKHQVKNLKKILWK